MANRLGWNQTGSGFYVRFTVPYKGSVHAQIDALPPGHELGAWEFNVDAPAFVINADRFPRYYAELGPAFDEAERWIYQRVLAGAR